MSDTPVAEAPLAVLRRAAERGTPLAPVHAALGVRLREVEPGRCTAAMTAPADPADQDPLSTCSLLGLLVLADFALGVAVNGTVGAGERIATLSLALQRVAPAVPGTALVAVGRLDDVVDGALTSSAEITDGTGRVLARARARNAVLSDALAAAYGDTPEAYDAPWSVPDLVPTTVDGAGVTARPHPRSANSADAVQGGLLAAVAARALAVVLGRVPDEVTATFPRAVPADGRAVRATATLEHGGRRLRTARAELGEDGGRVAVRASALSYAGGGPRG